MSELFSTRCVASNRRRLMANSGAISDRRADVTDVVDVQRTALYYDDAECCRQHAASQLQHHKRKCKRRFRAFRQRGDAMSSRWGHWMESWSHWCPHCRSRGAALVAQTRTHCERRRNRSYTNKLVLFLSCWQIRAMVSTVRNKSANSTNSVSPFVDVVLASVPSTPLTRSAAPTDGPTSASVLCTASRVVCAPTSNYCSAGHVSHLQASAFATSRFTLFFVVSSDWVLDRNVVDHCTLDCSSSIDPSTCLFTSCCL